MKIILKFENLILGIGLVIFFVLYGITLFTSKEIDFSFDLSVYGIEKFANVFKYSLYYFVGFIPTYGLVLAYQRMQQTEKRMKQTEIQNNNINFQNTFFSLLDLLTNFIQNLSYAQSNGRKVIEGFYDKLKGKAGSISTLEKTYNTYCIHPDGVQIRSYLNIINIILEHIIDNYGKISPNKEIDFYSDILISTLSEHEILIIIAYLSANKNSNLSLNIKKINLFEKYKFEDNNYNKILDALKEEMTNRII